MKLFIFIVCLACYFSYFKLFKKVPHADWPHDRYFYRYLKHIWKNWYWHTCWTGETKITEQRKSKQKRKTRKTQVESTEARDSKPVDVNRESFTMKFVYTAEVAIPVDEPEKIEELKR